MIQVPSKQFRIIADFVDKETGNEIKAGDVFAADDERAQALRAAGVIGKEVSKADTGEKEKATGAENADPIQEKALELVKQYHIGGGYYLIPGVEDKIHGKDPALKVIEEKLRAGELEGATQTNNTSEESGAKPEDGEQ